MTGYPPKPLEGDGSATLLSLGVRSGSVLVVKEPLGAGTANGSSTKPSSVFLRRVVPADNSCLFNAIGCVHRASGMSSLCLS